MNYDEMSDFEINLAVAKKLGLVVSAESNGHNAVDARCDDGYHAWFTIDYCNNWADIGPIIEKHGITLEYDYDLKPDAEWWSCVAFGDFGKVECNYLSNPRRAAAICFLMMQESK